ncbi:hypothetical protein BC938DRAFT_481230, partial [Jimgerdemannia flammicorona]
CRTGSGRSCVVLSHIPHFFAHILHFSHTVAYVLLLNYLCNDPMQYKTLRYKASGLSNVQEAYWLAHTILANQHQSTRISPAHMNFACQTGNWFTLHGIICLHK